MADEFNTAPPPPPPPSPPDPGQGPPPNRMPPPPAPPPMGFPVMMPPAPRKKGFASRLADALVVIIFAGSLVMNVVLLLAVIGLAAAAIGTPDGMPEVQAKTLIGGDSDEQIAVIDVKGAIDGEAVDRLRPQFEAVINDSDYKALLLRVDSPGGGVGASDTIAHFVQRVKNTNKPVVVLMGDVAASGGYYISAPADYIMAGHTTITGSIGVIAHLPNLSGSLEKIGMKVTVIPSTPATKKSIGSPFIPWDPANRDYILKFLDSAHNRFVSVIFTGRAKHFANREAVEALANGAALTAAEAKAANLIDQDKAHFEDAVAKAKSLARLTNPKVVKLSKIFKLRDVFGPEAKSSTPQVTIHPSTIDELAAPRLMYLWQGQ